MNSNLVKSIFSGIGLALGIAVFVLNIVNPLSVTTTTTLLGLGVAVLGIAALQKA